MSVTHSISHSGMALFRAPIQSTFGGLVIDLASAPIDPGEHELRIESEFGGIEIYLPNHVMFTVEGGALFGGLDVHEGHGLWNRIGRALRRLVGLREAIPDHGAPSPDPARPTSIKLSIDGTFGGIDIYRI